MASTTAGKRAQGKGNGGPTPSTMSTRSREDYLRTHLEIRHGAALEGHEIVVTKEPVTRCAHHSGTYSDVRSW